MSNIVSFKTAIALRDAGLKLIGDPMYRQHWYHIPAGDSGPLLYTDYNVCGDLVPRLASGDWVNGHQLDHDLVFAPTRDQLLSDLKRKEKEFDEKWYRGLDANQVAHFWLGSNEIPFDPDLSAGEASEIKRDEDVVSFKTAIALRDAGLQLIGNPMYRQHWYNSAFGDSVLLYTDYSIHGDFTPRRVYGGLVYAHAIERHLVFAPTSEQLNSVLKTNDTLTAEGLANLWILENKGKAPTFSGIATGDSSATQTSLPTVPDCYKLTYRIIVPCRYDLSRELSIKGGIISGDLNKILMFLGLGLLDYNFDLDAGVLTINSADNFDDYGDAVAFSDVLFRYVKEYVRADKWAVNGPDRMVLRCGEIEMTYAPAGGIHGKFFHFGFRSLGMLHPMWSADAKTATFNDCDLYAANRFINLLKMFSPNEVA